MRWVAKEKDDLARFLAHTRWLESGCIEWTNAPWTFGYGRFVIKSENGWRGTLAHRWIYERLIGPIPADLQIDHLCRNRLCVNPQHLEPVSQRENILRGDATSAHHARKTHCIYGHPLEGWNLKYSGRGERICRECYNRRRRKWLRNVG